eukprot:1283488-Rhodomonas_salina.7
MDTLSLVYEATLHPPLFCTGLSVVTQARSTEAWYPGMNNMFQNRAKSKGKKVLLNTNCCKKY